MLNPFRIRSRLFMKPCYPVNRCGLCLRTIPVLARPSWQAFISVSLSCVPMLGVLSSLHPAVWLSSGVRSCSRSSGSNSESSPEIWKRLLRAETPLKTSITLLFVSTRWPETKSCKRSFVLPDGILSCSTRRTSLQHTFSAIKCRRRAASSWPKSLEPRLAISC